MSAHGPRFPAAADRPSPSPRPAPHMMKRALCAAALAALASLPVPCLAPRPVDAGTAVRLQIEDLVREADLVFEGRVLAANAFRDPRGITCTEYTVSVHRSYWGAPQGTRVFTLPGGVLPDGSGTLIPGTARLAAGEDALLFLSGESRNGWRATVGLAQGLFEIERDAQGVASLTRSQADLVLVDPRSGAAQPAGVAARLAYDAVVARIEAAVERK